MSSPSTAVRPFEVTHRAVLAIALPMTLANLSTPLVGIVDTAVIGQLGNTALLGGIAIGALVFDVILSIFNFLRMGTTGLTAQAVGAGDRVELKAVFARAIVVALAIGLAIVALQGPILHLAEIGIAPSPAVMAAFRSYFEIRILATPLSFVNYVILGWVIGLGRADLGLALQVLLNLVNIGLNILFVYGMGLGIAGAALGTTAAEAVAVAGGIAVVVFATRGAPWPTWRRVFERREMMRMVAVNRDIMIRSIALMTAFAFFTAQGARAGDAVLAANAVLMHFFMVGGFFLDGLANAAEQLAGRAIGARYRPAFVRSVRLAVGWGFAFAAAASLLFIAGGPAMIDLVTTSPEVRATARLYLVWAALTPLAGVLAFEMDGVFVGATWSSDMRNMMLISIALYFALWAVFTPLFGNDGLWIALLGFLGARGLTLALRIPARLARTFPEARPALG